MIRRRFQSTAAQVIQVPDTIRRVPVHFTEFHRTTPCERVVMTDQVVDYAIHGEMEPEFRQDFIDCIATGASPTSSSRGIRAMIERIGAMDFDDSAPDWAEPLAPSTPSPSSPIQPLEDADE